MPTCAVVVAAGSRDHRPSLIGSSAAPARKVRPQRRRDNLTRGPCTPLFMKASHDTHNGDQSTCRLETRSTISDPQQAPGGFEFARGEGLPAHVRARVFFHKEATIQFLAAIITFHKLTQSPETYQNLCLESIREVITNAVASSRHTRQILNICVNDHLGTWE